MKKNIISFLVPLIFILSGLFVGFVPVVIPMIHQAETNGKIAEYSEKVSQLTDDERNEVVEEMKDYNSGGRSNFPRCRSEVWARTAFFRGIAV